MKRWAFWGVQSRSSLDEKVVSGLGALTGISLVFFVTDWLTNFELAVAILPSMGASAVLVLAVPHGTLSQPWALLAGNLLSALVGVCCATFITNMYLAAGSAVGLSILLMHVFRCIHPPGGATALIAVVGGDAVRELGFSYLLFPTLINCLIIFAWAMLFNNLFHWRRYPSSLMKYDNTMYSPETSGIQVRHLQKAMATLDEVLDIAPEQIKYIIDKADELMREENRPLFNIEVGGIYTNAAAGYGWAARQVRDISNHPRYDKRLVMYRTLGGAGKGKNGTLLLVEFEQWAKERVRPLKSN
ncbi:HPP family protein [Spongiibacter sp. KMU-158]|uniref:HPP family protein n=1 Tax=Spongiibacter pelagi TaxID=2760804 RepID=A0A927BYN1_9GAMM|nr:HPP family protein [Spongiibacter pelagi]MBD2857454.1 HPP family protein [Spongiibacter pelagi]